MKYVEPILVASVFAIAASHKIAEAVDASTTLGVIASIGGGTVAGILLTCSGISLTALSNREWRP